MIFAVSYTPFPLLRSFFDLRSFRLLACLLHLLVNQVVASFRVAEVANTLMWFAIE